MIGGSNIDNVLDELVIVKRSGQRVSFNGTKIALAIKNAFDSVQSSYTEEDINKVYSNVLEYIKVNYKDRKTINVEDVQDIIEKFLKEEKYIEVYYSFNNYRLKRAASRELFDRKQQHKFVRATEKLVLRREEEQMSTPINQLINFGKTISVEFSKAYLLDSKYVRSHDEGNIYIHDLDYYVLGTTKSTILDLSNIIPSVDYFDKIIEILLSFKEEQYGEHSFASFDYVLEPYVLYKFKQILKSTFDNMLVLEGFNDLINTKQLYMMIDKTNDIEINFDEFSEHLPNERIKNIFKSSLDNTIKDLKIDLFNNIKRMLYTLNKMSFGINNDTSYTISIGKNNSNVGLFITNVYFSVISDLDYLDKVTTIYKFNSYNELLDKVLNLILSKKNIMINNVHGFDESYKCTEEYFSTFERIKENLALKNQTSIGRMILSKTSINLVRIALKSKDLNEFYQELSLTMELVKNELLQTFEYKSNKYKNNFNYLFNNEVVFDSEKLDSGGRIRKVIKNGVLCVGYAGLKEAIYILLKKDKLTYKDLNLSVDILKFMKKICDDYIEEYKLNFYLSETFEPCVLKYLQSVDKSIYGNIKNVTDEYTYQTFNKIFDEANISLENRFKLESDIIAYSIGGYNETILINKNSTIESIKDILKLMQKYNIRLLKFEVDE